MNFSHTISASGASCDEVPAVVTCGSTKQFKLTASIDRGAGFVIWDLTSATVTVLFTKPDGTSLTALATVTDGPAGVAIHLNAASFFVAADVGDWRLAWMVEDSGVVEVSLPEFFTVIVSPGVRA